MEFGYLTIGLLLIVASFLALFSTLYGVWRRSFYGTLVVIPFVIGLYVLLSIPDAIPYKMVSGLEDTNYLNSVAAYSRIWYELHNVFPSTKIEFMKTMEDGPVSYRALPTPYQSPYGFRGKRLPYEIVVVNDATGPRIDHMTERPGVIYYCVSADLQQFWVTMSGLHENFAFVATVKHISDSESAGILLTTARGSDYPSRR